MLLKTVIALFFSVSIFAQQVNKPYPYRVESDIWLNNYRNLSTDIKRLSEIKKKIYSDTLYYNYKSRIILDNPRNPERHICKTLFFLKSNNEFIELDLQESPILIDFMNEINLKNIKSIRLLESPESEIYFGAKGICGIIYLECSQRLMKKLKKRIK
jgi:hypothetical protein